MARIKRSKTYQGLHTFPVYKNDTNNEVFNIIEVPEVFPRGKSYFLILGSDQFVQGSDLLIEILDKNGDVVYSEIPSYVESSGRAISVWVFSGTARGEAQITVVGKLRDVPSEWQGKYNVKTTIPIVINPLLVNNQPIRFENSPVVSASVADRAYLFVTESITELQIFTNPFYAAQGSYNASDGKYKVNLFTLALPPIAAPVYVNGIAHISNLKVGGVDFSSSYTASYEIIDTTNFYVDPPPFVYAPLITPKGTKYWVVYDDEGRETSIPKYIYNFDANYDWELHYQIVDTGSMTTLTASFAKIDFSNLQTFSGRIDSLKIYKKNLISDASYVLMGEFPAEPSELFISRSNSIDNFIGQFTSDAWVQLNWHSSSIDGGLLPASAHVQQTDLNIFDSIYMSQSEARPAALKVYPENTKMQFYGDAEYTLTVTLVGEPTSSLGDNAEMNIYVSGSAFHHTVLDDQLGKLVANILNDSGKFINYGERFFNFVADKTDTGTLVFEIVSGKWNAANISIQAASDDGFNADSLQVYVPLDNIKRNEIVNFKIEFLNSRKESAPTKVESTVPILLKNNPVYIEMDDNIVSGSISIGSSANTGLILAGKDAPTFKSVGYEGFNNALTNGPGGFAFYSGSPAELSQSFKGEDYQGVGFELQTEQSKSGSLAFRYNPTNPTGSYLIISASIYALPGSNVTLATGSGGGSGTGSSGLWTESVDGTYISRLGNVKISGSLYLSRSVYDAAGSSGSDGQVFSSDPNGLVKWSSTIKAPNFLGIAVSNEYAPITSSTTYVAMYMPHDFTLLDIKASLSLTGSANLTLDVLKNGATLLGANLITISGSVYTGSLTGINTALLTNDRIDVRVMTDGSGSSGLKVYLVGSSSLNMVYTSSYAVSASYAGSASWIESSSWAATASYYGGAAGLWTASSADPISRFGDVQVTGSMYVSGGNDFRFEGLSQFYAFGDTAYISASSDIQIGNYPNIWMRLLPGPNTMTLLANSGDIYANSDMLYVSKSAQIGDNLTVLKNASFGFDSSNRFTFTGSIEIGGFAEGGISSSNGFFGTASWAEHALTASYVPIGVGTLWTASADGVYISRDSNVQLTGSFTSSEGISATGEINTFGSLYVLKNTFLGDGVTDKTEITGSIHWNSATGSLFGTASWAESASRAISSSYAISSSWSRNTYYNDLIKEPTGFPNRTDTTLFFHSSSHTFQITGSNWKVYVGGEEYIKNNESLVLADLTKGISNYIYYAVGTGILSQTQTAWDFLSGNTPVATIFLGAKAGTPLVSDERHGIVMDGATHEYIHETIGARYQSGLAWLTTTASLGKFEVGVGHWHDDDIDYNITTPITESRIAWYSASMVLTTYLTSSIYDGNPERYNDITTGATSSLAGGQHGAFFVYAVNDISSSLLSVMGQRVDVTLAAARTNNTPESLVFGNFPFTEAKLLYRIIVSTAGIVETTDYRTAQALGTTYTPTSHGTLTGLTVDDHPQYLLLAGRATQSIVDAIQLSGSLIVSNSVVVIGSYDQVGDMQIKDGSITSEFGFSGSLFGTSSWAVSASWAPGGAGGLWTASLDGVYISRDSDVQVTGSLFVSGGFVNSAVFEKLSQFYAFGDTVYISASSDIQIGKIDASWIRLLPTIINISGSGILIRTQDLEIQGPTAITGSLNVSAGITGSLYGTSSWAESSSWAQYAATSSVSVTSASYALSSSYALSASYAPGGSPAGSGVGEKIFLWQNFR
jgi:hypothetical protein